MFLPFAQSGSRKNLKKERNKQQQQPKQQQQVVSKLVFHAQSTITVISGRNKTNKQNHQHTSRAKSANGVFHTKMADFTTLCYRSM